MFCSEVRLESFFALEYIYSPDSTEGFGFGWKPHLTSSFCGGRANTVADATYGRNAMDESLQLEMELDVPPVAKCASCGKHKEIHRMKETSDDHYVCREGSCEDDYTENVYGNYGQ